MADADPGTGNYAPNVLRHPVDRLDAIVNEEYLSAAIELARDSFVDEPIVPRLDVGQHRRSVPGRRLH